MSQVTLSDQYLKAGPARQETARQERFAMGPTLRVTLGLNT